MKRFIITHLFFLLLGGYTFAQESIIDLVKNNRKQGDYYFDQGQYEKALHFYNQLKEDRVPLDVSIKMARCYYLTKAYLPATNLYQKIRSEKSLSLLDLIYYSESHSALGNYDEAIEIYKEILTIQPGDNTVLKKLWQLKNITILFEDSIQYSVRPLSINTPYAEFSPKPFQLGIVFLTDRKEVDFNSGTGSDSFAPRIYYAETDIDNIGEESRARFKKTRLFNSFGKSKSQYGTLTFYGNDEKCIYTASSGEPATDGIVKMQLFFTEKTNGIWVDGTAFDHNDKEYNLTDPAVSRDGKILYFSSDKPGGSGGFDLYRSEFIMGKWSTPQNLQDINTYLDESFPFVHYNTLYFSSNGHAGLGGLDLFSIVIDDNFQHELKNLGYPLNSNGDDFGISFLTRSHGYFSSNRKNGGFDDDLYEFEMDFRTYPFEISGIVKMKESNEIDFETGDVMAGAKIYLIDYVRETVAFETNTDADGKFSISIPRFSRYALRIVGIDKVEHIVSLEIDRKLGENSEYEIVVIRNLFQITPSTGKQNHK